jgi:hypothetical protein
MFIIKEKMKLPRKIKIKSLLNKKKIVMEEAQVEKEVIVSILFKSKDVKIKGENCSKLIDEESELAKIFWEIRDELAIDFPKFHKNKIHIELSKSKIDDEIMKRRTNELHGLEINLSDFDKWSYRSHALMYTTPKPHDFEDKWGNTHCTVAYFYKNRPSDIEQLLEYVKRVLKKYSS